MSVCLLMVSISVYVLNIFIQDRNTGSIYNLYFETNNISLNIERLGVMAASVLDVERFIFGFDEKIKMVDMVDDVIDEDELFEYEYFLK